MDLLQLCFGIREKLILGLGWVSGCPSGARQQILRPIFLDIVLLEKISESMKTCCVQNLLMNDQAIKEHESK